MWHSPIDRAAWESCEARLAELRDLLVEETLDLAVVVDYEGHLFDLVAELHLRAPHALEHLVHGFGPRLLDDAEHDTESDGRKGHGLEARICRRLEAREHDYAQGLLEVVDDEHDVLERTVVLTLLLRDDCLTVVEGGGALASGTCHALLDGSRRRCRRTTSRPN